MSGRTWVALAVAVSMALAIATSPRRAQAGVEPWVIGAGVGGAVALVSLIAIIGFQFGGGGDDEFLPAAPAAPPLEPAARRFRIGLDCRMADGSVALFCW